MTGEAESLVASAEEAVAQGAVDEALTLLDRALTLEDLPDARELLGVLAYADDHIEAVCREWAAAVTGYRRDGRLRDAARVATRLGEVHWNVLGNPAAGRGWLERARRFLDEVGPCVEWGYLELALIACDRPNVDELLASAQAALQIAIENGDAGLEVRALADGGLALISQGRIDEGFRQLDEAFAALADVSDRYITGTTLCALLASCDRAGDLSRATELVQFTHDHVLTPTGGRPRILGTHCQVAYGGVLCAAGRWPDAEVAILEALSPSASVSVVHRVEAAARLAEIRVHQGRVDEAAELVARYEAYASAGGALALVHASRGDFALSRAVLERTLAQMIGDVVRRAPLLALLVECELALDDLVAASAAAERLATMEREVDVPFVAVLACQARSRVALADGDAGSAVADLSRARDLLAVAGRPLMDAMVYLDLSRAQVAAGDVAAAVDAARAAHAAAVLIGALGIRDRAAAELRGLGVAAPRPTPPASVALAGLTARELEVLDGIRRGETNAEIAARLFLAPKTVEHHVSRVLAKLGVRSRSEAAAAAATALVDSGGE